MILSMEERLTELYSNCLYAFISHLVDKLKLVKNDNELQPYIKTLLQKVSKSEKLPTPSWLNSFHEEYVSEHGDGEKLKLEFQLINERFDCYAALLKLICKKYGNGDYTLYFSLVMDVPDEEITW